MTPTACPWCTHFRRPGKADGYCASTRPDLAPAYGKNHPLRQLPANGGTGCRHFAPARWLVRTEPQTETRPRP